MIVYSDNTATNMVLDHIGIGSTNARMKSLGLTETRINSKVYRGGVSTVDPPRSKLYGLGSTTAKEMVTLLELLHQGKVASPEACKTMLAVLEACDDKEMMARHLPAKVKFAHKTGAVSGARTEAGIVYLPGGPVAVCVLTNDNDDKRFVPDNAAQVLLAEVGRQVCEHYKSPVK